MNVEATHHLRRPGQHTKDSDELDSLCIGCVIITYVVHQERDEVALEQSCALSSSAVNGRFDPMPSECAPEGALNHSLHLFLWRRC